MNQEVALPMFMSAKQVAETIWRCNPRTLRRAWKRGQINAVLRGRTLVFETASVLRWLGSDAPSTPIPPLVKRGRGRPRKVRSGDA